MAASTLTASEIVTRALKLILLYAADETPTAEDMETGLAALNSMAFGWLNEDVDIGWTMAVAATVIPVEQKHEEGLIALLAKRLTMDFSTSLDPRVDELALNGWRRLEADYITVADPTFDYALTRTPSRRWPYSVPSS